MIPPKTRFSRCHDWLPANWKTSLPAFQKSSFLSSFAVTGSWDRKANDFYCFRESWVKNGWWDRQQQQQQQYELIDRDEIAKAARTNLLVPPEWRYIRHHFYKYNKPHYDIIAQPEYSFNTNLIHKRIASSHIVRPLLLLLSSRSEPKSIVSTSAC